MIYCNYYFFFMYKIARAVYDIWKSPFISLVSVFLN